ncbi:hypothetical protein [Nannocystis pusilla]|uniref:VWA domain-containing protein n=1 Tax=Nannocystis pusilla TaxID=889268 RepID=A0ABS7U2N1_9BACT|nr:hypothetical protein [Nannocystis pusilla]MBZ5714571.1 hypothetical protein [Nannocystis pusilla]
MTRLPLTLSLLVPLVAACELKGISLTGDDTGNDPPGTSGDPTGDSTGDPPGLTTTADPTDSTTGEPEPPVTAVDVLFVIDNSGSMANHQSRLVASIPSFLEGLDGLDLRIAVTTTDAANPRCPAAQTTPEGGKFVMRSCHAAVALGDFTFNMQDYSEACTDHCTIDPADFIVAPTATADDPDPKPRNWLERTNGQLNVAAGLADALACTLPQGVSGCGFESPLESMYLALAQTALPGSPTNYGFLRPEADLRIVFITDEMDCSYVPEFSEIFTTNKTFWEDPDRPDATSAVCFNAGVTCTGGPGTYTECHATNHDVTGAITGDPSEAVLQPLSKYVQFLQGIQASKTGGATVRVIGLAGVPQDFETGEVPLVYADHPNAEEQDLFGIGPGCTAPDPLVSSDLAAYPPARLLEFAQPFDGQFFSICDDDFDAAMKVAGFKP